MKTVKIDMDIVVPFQIGARVFLTLEVDDDIDIRDEIGKDTIPQLKNGAVKVPQGMKVVRRGVQMILTVNGEDIDNETDRIVSALFDKVEQAPEFDIKSFQVEETQVVTRRYSSG